MRLPIVLCSLVVLSSQALAASKLPAAPALSSYSPSSSTINHGAFEIEGRANYFQTTGHFDYDGTKVPLNEGSGFEKIDGDTYLRYGISRQIQVDIGARYRQNHSYSESLDITASGLESYTAGAKYSFDSFGRWLFAVELRYRQSAYSNEDLEANTATPTDKLELGDAGGEATALAHITFERTKSNLFSAYIGYNRPGNSLSPEIPWNVETAFKYQNWAFIGGVKGLTSLGASDYTESVDLKPRQANGETMLFNSVNRAYMEPFLGINYASGRWRIEGKMGHVLSGVSTDEGNEFQIGLVYNTGGTTLTEKKVESFKEYEVEGTVLKVSPRSTFVKIDQGTAHDIEKGMKFDIFNTDYYGGNEMVATGVAYEVGATWTIIKILKTYKEDALKKGQTARGR